MAQAEKRAEYLRQPADDLGKSSLHDAMVWVSRYVGLVDLETGALESVKGRLKGMSSAARRISQETDLPALESDLASFRERLALWRDRVSELQRLTRTGE